MTSHFTTLHWVVTDCQVHITTVRAHKASLHIADLCDQQCTGRYTAGAASWRRRSGDVQAAVRLFCMDSGRSWGGRRGRLLVHSGVYVSWCLWCSIQRSDLPHPSLSNPSVIIPWAYTVVEHLPARIDNDNYPQINVVGKADRMARMQNFFFNLRLANCSGSSLSHSPVGSPVRKTPIRRICGLSLLQEHSNQKQELLQHLIHKLVDPQTVILHVIDLLPSQTKLIRL